MIATDRLILRRWREDDAASHHAMCADADVSRFLGPPLALEQSRETVANQNGIADRYGSCFWAVDRRVDARFVGWCGVKPGPEATPIAGEPEIGWSLAREAWGQGSAVEAACAALVHFWQARPAQRTVFAITTPANDRSWGLMFRLGMMRLADGDFDHPALAEGDPLRRHLTYAIDRP